MTKFAGLKAMREERQQAKKSPAARKGKVQSVVPAVIEGPRRVGRPAGKRSNPDYQQVTLLLHRDTYMEARRRLLEQDKDVSDVLNELLLKWLK